MSITQTVEVPASRRVTLDIPPQIPVGPVILTFTPKAAAKQLPSPLPGGSPATIEEALRMAAEKAADPNRKPISRLFGKLSPEAFGDSVAYQRAIRDEWGG